VKPFPESSKYQEDHQGEDGNGGRVATSSAENHGTQEKGGRNAMISKPPRKMLAEDYKKAGTKEHQEEYGNSTD